ncbi:MAG: sulfotransferase family 2 domain-containing protein [Bacteroidetes bacterium]|nr:sulfotransferase family 2 domain-containing protein [Bacteroidota bacterium]
MIISHKYKFIFIKTNKTAGTSIEIALSKICGKKDVITPISPDDEKVRRQIGISAQNYFIPYNKYTSKDLVKLFVKMKRKVFYNHIPAIDVKNSVSKEIWNSYYKFCFDRNPFDKIISHYYFISIEMKILILNPILKKDT